LPAQIAQNLTLGAQFDIEIPPGGWNDLKTKPFTEKSGSGWYLLFAMPAEIARSSDAEWQLLRPTGSSQSAVQLFRKRNINLVIKESATHALYLEVTQDDRELESCSSTGTPDAA
jgi:hypothetical protein